MGGVTWGQGTLSHQCDRVPCPHVTPVPMSHRNEPWNCPIDEATEGGILFLINNDVL